MQAGDREGLASAQNGSFLEALARETDTEPARVRELYEQALAQLEANAKVQGFLSVLACRSVRLTLRET